MIISLPSENGELPKVKVSVNVELCMQISSQKTKKTPETVLACFLESQINCFLCVQTMG